MISIFFAVVFISHVLSHKQRPAVVPQDASELSISSDEQAPNTVESCLVQLFGDVNHELNECDHLSVNALGSCDLSLDVTCRQMQKCRETIEARGDPCVRADTGLADDSVYCHALHDRNCEEERENAAVIGKFIRHYATSTWSSINSWLQGPPVLDGAAEKK